MKRKRFSVALIALATLPILSVSQASAMCAIYTTIGTYGSDEAYWQPAPGDDLTGARLTGRFWQLGNRAAGSYLAHFDRASSHRLLVGLRLRFSWLDEYFVWDETSVEFRCPVPRLALRFTQQTSWFLERLSGHVVMVREGPFWERITEGVSAAAIEAWPRRFPLGLLPSNVPAAWIDETGRRPGSIAERALIRRWGAAGAPFRV